MPGKNPDTVWNLVVWNLNGKAYDGYMEAEVQWGNEFPWYTKGIRLEDSDGTLYPCQVIREKSVLPGFRSRFIFRGKIPAVGYKVFKLLQTEEAVQQKSVDPYRIITEELTVTFSRETGCIESVCDTHSGKILVKNVLIPACYGDKGDTWAFNIKTYERDRRTPRFLGMRVIEAGEQLVDLKASYAFGSSHIDMYYRFYRDTDYFDVRYRVNWEEAHTVLKLETDILSTSHMAAVPAGAIARGENPVDVPLGAWVNMDGVVFAPNAMFAYNVTENKLGLTVLRSPIHGDLRILEIDETLDYDIVDRGIVEGGLRIAFDGDPWLTAEQFNNPPVIIDEANHDGSLGATGSFCEVRGETVLLSALKRCEDDMADVVRLIETNGKACTAEVVLRDSVYSVQMKPFEIKTLKIFDGKIDEVNLLEQ